MNREQLEIPLKEKILEILVMIIARYNIALSPVQESLINASAKKQPELMKLVSFKFIQQHMMKRAVGSRQALSTLGYFHKNLQNDLVPPLSFIAYDRLLRSNRTNDSKLIPQDLQKRMKDYLSLRETNKDKRVSDFIALTVEDLVKSLHISDITGNNLDFILRCLARGGSLSSDNIFSHTCDVVNRISNQKFNSFLAIMFVYSCKVRNYPVAIEIIKQKSNDSKFDFNATDIDLNTAAHHLVSRSILLGGNNNNLLKSILNTKDDLDKLKTLVSGNELKFLEDNWDYLNLVKWLLDRKLPQLRNNAGLTPFLCAVREGDLPIVEKLGEKGVNYCVYTEINPSLTQELGLARYTTAIDLVKKRPPNDPQKVGILRFLEKRIDAKIAHAQWYSGSKYLFLIPVGLVITAFMLYQHYANCYAQTQESATALKNNPLMTDEIMTQYNTAMSEAITVGLVAVSSILLEELRGNQQAANEIQATARAAAPALNDAMQRAKERLSPEHLKLLADVRLADSELDKLYTQNVKTLCLYLGGALAFLIALLIVRMFRNDHQKRGGVLHEDKSESQDDPMRPSAKR